MSEDNIDTEIARNLASLHAETMNKYLSTLDVGVSYGTLLEAEGIFLVNTAFIVSKDYAEFVMMVRQMILYLTRGVLISQEFYDEMTVEVKNEQ